jgi:predicted metal-dependent phosphoesterase TrpH
LAITDHDSTAGYEAVLPLQKQAPQLRLIPAIEMSAEGELGCHLLGYFIDPAQASFQAELVAYRAQRVVRVRAMAEKLKTLGFSLDFERVLALAQGGSLGRPHLADALVELGAVKSRQEAFDRFLKKNGPAYIAGETPTAGEVIRLIRSAGGIPVLAHPSYYTSDSLIKQLVELGLEGLEAYYPEHSRALIGRYRELAAAYRLVMTGGSDFHGPRTGRTELACVDVPEEVVTELEAARTRLS